MKNFKRRRTSCWRRKNNLRPRRQPAAAWSVDGKLHQDRPVVGEKSADDLAARPAAPRWEENKIQRAARPERRIGADAGRGIKGVLAVPGKIIEQGGGG